jgi:hypothetical protein
MESNQNIRRESPSALSPLSFRLPLVLPVTVFLTFVWLFAFFLRVYELGRYPVEGHP